MRLLLLNGWSDDNKGDAAIVQGLVSLLTAASGRLDAGRTATFGIVSTLRNANLHLRHTSNFGPGVIPYTSLLPRDPGGRTAASRRIGRAYFIARSIALLLLARKRRSRSIATALLDSDEKRTYRALAGSDMAISKGGHIFFSYGGWRSVIGLYTSAFPLLLAQRLGTPAVIYSQSIGPIHGGLSRRLLAYLLRRCRFVLLREPLSRRLAESLIGPQQSIGLCWDTALCLEVEQLPTETERSLPPRFVALTLRPWHFPGRANAYPQYLSVMAKLVSRINQELGVPVLLVPQVLGPTDSERDAIAWSEVIDRVRHSHEGEASLIELNGDFTPGQLASVYSKALLVVGTRFHSVILALSQGVPALAISYHGFKTPGIMQMFGLNEYCFDIDRLDVDRVFAAVRDVLGRRDELSGHIERTLESVRRASVFTANEVLASVDGTGRC